jgi:DNA polymerase III delta prime subunit
VFCWLTGLRNRTASGEALLVRRLLAEQSSVLCGDFSRLDVKSIGEYVSTLEDSLSYLEEQTCSPFLPLREKNAQLAAKGRETLARVQLQRREKIIRRQPFAFIIAGPPGCGKSFAAMRLATDLYRSIHGKWSSDELIVLNEGDDFQSEFRSTHKIVVFDDLGATRVSVVSHDPFRKVIDFVNNIPRTALNPHLDLKGNVWINPEIVVATTNMNVPFVRKQYANTDSITCVDAINRRFPLMIIQEDYGKFHLKDPLMSDKCEDFSATFQRNAIAYDELLAIALKMYREHYGAQEEFVSMVENQLQMESGAGSMLTFSAIVALQAALRFYVSSLAFRQHISEASFLSTIRRFIALDLQSLKCSARQGLVNYLRLNANLSGPEITHLLTDIQKSTNLAATAMAVLLHARSITSLVEAIEVAIPIVSNCMLRRARSIALPYYYTSLIYDVATVALPAILGKYWENVVDEIRDKDPGFGTNQPIDNTSDVKKLGTYFGDKYRHYYGRLEEYHTKLKSRLYALLQKPELVPEGRKHAKSFPAQCIESGKLIKCKVSRAHKGPFEPDAVGSAIKIYASLAAYKSHELSFREFMIDAGAMTRGNYSFLYGMNILHNYFTFGPYFLVYREDANILYVLRTVNIKLKFNLNEMYTFANIVNTVGATSVIFIGRAGSRLVTAPLFGDSPVETLQEDIEEIFSHDFMVKSLINVNGSKPTTIKAHLCAIQMGNLNRDDLESKKPTPVGSKTKKKSSILPPAPGEIG